MNRSAFRTGRLFVVLALAAPAVGCVERRMTIRSEPSNALVTLDGKELGFTPVSTSFNYYGDRKVKLSADGYDSLVVHQRVSTPWYQVPPLDFVSEALWPFRIRDQREYTYTMQPTMMVRTDELLSRADQTRVEGNNPPEQALRRAKVTREELGINRPDAAPPPTAAAETAPPVLTAPPSAGSP
ncbi:MAG: PEGA domain-containing protein [Planctomycetia bacterium]